MLPAGRSNDAGYTEKLADLDWRSLYTEQMGYLFFEDTKATVGVNLEELDLTMF